MHRAAPSCRRAWPEVGYPGVQAAAGANSRFPGRGGRCRRRGCASPSGETLLVPFRTRDSASAESDPRTAHLLRARCRVDIIIFSTMHRIRNVRASAGISFSVRGFLPVAALDKNGARSLPADLDFDGKFNDEL